MGIYLSWLILYPSEQCGASLQESSLNKVVQMLKTAIVTELRHWMETNENVYNVKILLTMMKEVYKVRVHPKDVLGVSQLESCFVMFFTTERIFYSVLNNPKFCLLC